MLQMSALNPKLNYMDEKGRICSANLNLAMHINLV